MENKQNTSQSIMESLQKMAEQTGGADPHAWLTASLKLRVLLQKDQEELVDLERKVQELKASYLMIPNESATSAKIKTETSDLWVETKKKEVMIKTALDIILLAKRFAQTEMDIYKAQ